MAVCPECEERLPWETSCRRAAPLGLPDKRTLDCPYCGAPLEPIRWADLALLAVILALVVAARKLIGPLLDWRTVAVFAGLAVGHHVWTIRRLRKERREKDASGRMTRRAR